MFVEFWSKNRDYSHRYIYVPVKAYSASDSVKESVFIGRATHYELFLEK